MCQARLEKPVLQKKCENIGKMIGENDKMEKMYDVGWKEKRNYF